MPFAFTGKLDRLTLKLDRPKLTPADEKRPPGSMQRNNRAKRVEFVAVSRPEAHVKLHGKGHDEFDRDREYRVRDRFWRALFGTSCSEFFPAFAPARNRKTSSSWAQG